MFADTPEPPYHAVIFTSQRSDDERGYAELAQRMVALAAQQPGYLGIETVRDAKTSITISYWRDAESATAWKQNGTHLKAQRLGRERFYSAFRVRIARVERASGNLWQDRPG